MIYSNFKDKKLSKLGCGSLYFKTIDKNGPIDLKKMESIIDYAYSKGVNYFDTSCMYADGECEEFLGRILSKYPRDNYYLASKMPPYLHQKKNNIKKEFFSQLYRCRVEYFDFYMIQGISENNENYLFNGEILQTLIELKNNNLIKYLGFSFHGNLELLCKIIPLYKWDFIMLQLNYFDWKHNNAQELYEKCIEAELPIFVMKPNKGGLLLPYGADLSFAWLNQLSGIKTILSGMNEIEQVENNLKYIENFYIDQEKIEQAINDIYNNVLIPCTNCKYCLPCPQNYIIPEWISNYNNCILYNDVRNFIPPPNCISCGQCEIKCPQKIQIRKIFQKYD